eukprot:3405700-Rhodomonas_salina.1
MQFPALTRRLTSAQVITRELSRAAAPPTAGWDSAFSTPSRVRRAPSRGSAREPLIALAGVGGGGEGAGSSTAPLAHAQSL